MGPKYLFSLYIIWNKKKEEIKDMYQENMETIKL